MSIKKVMATISATAIFTSLIGVLPTNEASPIADAKAASVCVVDTTTEYQTIRGFGGINHPEWTGKDLTAAQRKTAFGNGENELGMNILRVFINPDRTQWSRAVETAKYAQSQGAVLFASPWEPPADIAEPGTGGRRGGKLHIPKENYGKYVQHLNDFYNYMKDNGVDIYAISVQNEPDCSSEWTAWSSDETTDFLANYGDKIECKVMSPETFQYTNKDYYSKILDNPKAFANCDLFATHLYGTQRSQMDFPALEKSGKEIWMTEVYVPNSEPDSDMRWPESIKVSENIHNSFVVGNMSAYVWWYIRRNYSPLCEDGSISKRGYCFAQYSKFIRPGDVRVNATEQPDSDILVSAYKNDNKQLTIVAINKGADSITQEFNIGSGETVIDVDRYRTSADENLAVTENMENSDHGFFAQLPSNSVSTFVVSLEGSGIAPGTQTDKDGYWFHSDFENDGQNWTSRGSVTLTQSGKENYTSSGKNSLLVSDRTSTWMGASYELNTNSFKAGETYSFSTHVKQNSGQNVKFMMKLEYTDANNETTYNTIATVTAPSGKWSQLANTEYTIPTGASNIKIYIETEESLTDYYVDEAIGAPKGTAIKGEGQPEIPAAPTNPPTSKVISGDLDNDGFITIYDMIIARKGFTSTFTSNQKKAIDVDQDGTVKVNDLVLLENFILGKIDKFPVNKPATEVIEKTYNFPAVSKLSASSDIPDPFVFMDGSKVDSPAEWNKRANEISCMYEYYMYGKWRDGSDEEVSYKINGKQMTITVKRKSTGKTASFPVNINLPSSVRHDGGAPVIVGMHSGISESTAQQNGYAVLTVGGNMFSNPVASDDTNHKGAFYDLYPYGNTWEEQTGVLMAWSWGCSKILDALYNGAAKDLNINPDSSIVTGVSRWGKAAAVCGAFDKRFKMVAPSCSGAGGLALYRYKSTGRTYDFSSKGASSAYKYGDNEPLGSLQSSAERGWFNNRFLEFKNANNLPMDQHMLGSLVADQDRYLFVIASCVNEDWVNAPSMWHGYLATKKVYDYLGISDNIAVNIHKSGHAVIEEDVKYMVQYFDYHVYGIKPTMDLKNLQTSVFALDKNKDADFVNSFDSKWVY